MKVRLVSLVEYSKSTGVVRASEWREREERERQGKNRGRLLKIVSLSRFLLAISTTPCGT
jgi:hypothetical protein